MGKLRVANDEIRRVGEEGLNRSARDRLGLNSRVLSWSERVQFEGQESCQILPRLVSKLPSLASLFV